VCNCTAWPLLHNVHCTLQSNITVSQLCPRRQWVYHHALAIWELTPKWQYSPWWFCSSNRPHALAPNRSQLNVFHTCSKISCSLPLTKAD